jgi:osmotically-inducible protein OsmY
VNVAKSPAPSPSPSLSLACPVTQAASARLRQSAYGPVRRVACAFDNGVLLLSGRLQSFFHKQLAQEAVAGLAGVRRVSNQIEVLQAA